MEAKGGRGALSTKCVWGGGWGGGGGLRWREGGFRVEAEAGGGMSALSAGPASPSPPLGPSDRRVPPS